MVGHSLETSYGRQLLTLGRSLKKVNELSLQIDMDKEKGHELVPRKVRPGGDSALHSRGPRPDNIIRVQIRQTTVVDLSNVDMYLAGKMDFDNGHLASISKCPMLLFFDAIPTEYCQCSMTPCFEQDHQRR
jgi:hypothetical protein